MTGGLRAAPVWFLLFISFYIASMPSLFIMGVCAALCHEAAHAAAIELMGGGRVRAALAPAGIRMESDRFIFLGYGQEFAAALCGPLMSALLAAAFFFLWREGLAPGWAKYFSGINLILCLFNLLPVWPLDGGRMLRCLLVRLLPFAAAEWALRAVSWVFALGCVLVGAAVLFASGYNFSLLFAGVFLCMGLIGSGRVSECGKERRLFARL